jgi:Putative DNA-binding domain
MHPSAKPAIQGLAGLQAGFRRAMLEPSLAVPAGMAPARRFSVYRNNVYASLTDALRARYPVVERLVGLDFFKMAAAAFICAHPPSSPVLIEYGAAFPAFLESFEPARELPYLGDTARLERLRNTACHAADREPLIAADLAAVSPGAVDGLRFEFHPSAGLIASPYPIVSIWETNAYDAEVRAIGPELPGEGALVVRPGLEVHVVRLSVAEHAFATALAAGETLAEAALRAGMLDGSGLATSLAKLIAAGAFSGFSPGPIHQGDLPCSA